MNISEAWHLAAGRDGPSVSALAALRAAVQRQAARALKARHRRAACRMQPLDDRILRDLGITPLGVRETALANRNELGATPVGRAGALG